MAISNGSGNQEVINGTNGADNITASPGDDDIILGNGGDDTINAGNGNDHVSGGSGDDVINGGAGDDLIYGDINDSIVGNGEPTRLDFDDLASGRIVSENGAIAAAVQLNGFSNITRSYTAGKYTPEGGLFSGEHTGQYSANFTFDNAVSDVSFTLYDINQGGGWDDQVQVIALDADGNQVPVNFSGTNVATGGVDVRGDTVDGNNNNTTFRLDSNNPDNVQVSIQGPIVSLQVIHEPGNDTSTRTGWMGISDINATLGGEDVVDAGTNGSLIGDDVIDGGEGNDIIYGDNNEDLSTNGTFTGPRESFNWQGLNDTQADNSVVQDTGDVKVTYTRITDAGRHESKVNDAEQLDTAGIDSGAEVIDTDSSLESVTNGNGNKGAFQWEFDQPVGNVEFNVNDLDGGSGVVTVTAIGPDGKETQVQLVGGNAINISGNTASSIDSKYQEVNDPDTTVQVVIEGPVTSIVVEHVQQGGSNSGVNITDIYFDTGFVTVADDPDSQVGNDIINGGTGDDVIYGDNGEAQEAEVGPLTTLDFSDLNGGQLASENGAVTASVQLSGFSNITKSYTQGKYTPEGGLFSGEHSGAHTADFTFDNPVSDVSFTLYDINQGGGWDDQVQVIALDADGNQVPVNFSGTNVATGGVDVRGDTVDGNNNNTTFRLDSNNPDNVQVSIQGPIVSLQVIHEPGNDTSARTGWMGISDITVAPVVVDGNGDNDGNDGIGGDDIITGGEGADQMFGQGGNDTFIVGSEAEGAGDVIVGGNGPDQNTDNDVLDLRGAGPVTIDDAADENDAGARAGTVTFENGSTLEFSQIEEILQDEVQAPELSIEAAPGTPVDENGNPVAQENGDPVDVVITRTGPLDQPLVVTLGTDDPTEITGPQTVTIPAGQASITVPVTPVDDPDVDGDQTPIITATAPGFDTVEQPIVVQDDDAVVNQGPDAVDDDIAQSPVGEPVVISPAELLANDSDPEGDAFTPVSIQDPVNGTVEFDGANFIFTPTPGYEGPASFTYTIAEVDTGKLDTATVNLTIGADPVLTIEAAPGTPVDENGNPVTSENGDPAFVVVTRTGPTDEPLEVTLSSDDPTEGTVPETVTIPAGQSAVIVPVTPVDDPFVDGDQVPTITADAQGFDPVTQGVVVQDDDFSAEPELIIEPAPGVLVDENGNPVTSENGSPTFLVVTRTGPIDEPLEVTLTSDDPTEGAVPETVTIPAGQSVVIVPVTPVDDPFVDGDQVPTITADAPGFDPATQDVVVQDDDANQGPDAVDDPLGAVEAGVVTIDPATLLANDTDPDGDTLQGVSVQDPVNGTVAFDGTNVIFTPTEGYAGPASFTYTITDGNGGTDTAKVDLVVNGIVDPVAPSAPTAAPDMTPESDTGVSDVDDITGDTTPSFTVEAPGDNTPVLYVDGVEVPSTYDPVEGTLTPNDPIGGGISNITYTFKSPTGEESAPSPSLPVLITTPKNLPAPDMTDETDTGISNVDDITSDATPGFFATPITGDQTITLYVDGEEVAATRTAGGAYVPVEPLSEGPHEVSYTVTDNYFFGPFAGQSVESNPSPVLPIVIDVTAPEIDPVVPSDNPDPSSNAPDMTAETDTGISDTDEVTKLNQPDFAVDVEAGETPELYIDGELVEATFDPVNSTLTPVAPLADGPHEVSYKLVDTAGNASALSESLPIVIDTTAPDAGSPADMTPETDTGVSDSDDFTSQNNPDFAIDPVGDDTPALYVDGVKVEATFDATANTLTPVDALPDGVYEISYTLTDPAGNESAQSQPLAIEINQTGLNQNPDAVDDPLGAVDAGVVTIDPATLLANDTDPDGDTLQGVSVQDPVNGTVAFDGTNVIFTPTEGYAGPASFTYTITDGNGGTDTAKVDLVVNGIVDPVAPSAPTAAPDMTPESDTGVSDVDDITGDTTPSFTVEAPGDNTPVLYVDGVEVPSTYDPVEGTLTPNDPIGGGISNITYTFKSPTGEESAPSPSLPVLITTPKNLPAPDMTDETDTGISNVDDITSDATPGFFATPITGDQTITLYVDGEEVAATRTAGGAYVPVEPLSEGPHEVSYTVTDNYFFGPFAGQSVESNPSPVLPIVIDTTAPTLTPTPNDDPNAVTTAPDLTPETDTGISNVDDLTADSTPSFLIGEVGDATPALYINREKVPSEYDAVNNTLTPTGPLPDGVYEVVYTLTDIAGNESLPSDALPFTVDTTAPDAPTVAPDMTPETDTGVSNSDDITGDTTPSFTVAAPGENTPVLYVDGVEVPSTYDSVAQTLTPVDPVAEGPHEITYTLKDLAGNESAASPALPFVIDTTPDVPVDGENLVFNGSFEDVTGMSQEFFGYQGDGEIPNWTDKDGYRIDVHNDGRGGLEATDGNNWLDLGGVHSNNHVVQTINGVQEGNTYQLTFDAGDIQTAEDGLAGDNTLTVIWGGEVIAEINPADGVMNQYTFNVIGGAGDGNNRLEFKGEGKVDNFGVSLDKIRLVSVDGDVTNPDDANTAPDAQDDAINGVQDNAVVIDPATLLANDVDADGDVLQGVSVQSAVNGTVDFDGTNIIFTPVNGYTGPASFTYTVSDDSGALDTATVNLTIESNVVVDPVDPTGPENQAPVAVDDDMYTTLQGEYIISKSTLLGNDYDPDGDPLTVTIDGAENGTVAVDGDHYVFTANEGYSGPASFTYTISDGKGGTDSATVNVTVIEQDTRDFPEGVVHFNDVSPGVDATPPAGWFTDNPGGVIEVLPSNVYGLDGPVSNVMEIERNPGDASNFFTLVDSDEGDVFTLAFDYSPRPNFEGGENSAVHIVVDGEIVDTINASTAGFAPYSVTIPATGEEMRIEFQAANQNEVGGLLDNIALSKEVVDTPVTGGPTPVFEPPVIDDPDVENDNSAPEVNDDVVAALPGNVVVIDPATLLANDVDADGDTLTDFTVSNAVNGTVVFDGENVVFTPFDGYQGPASFSYSVSDGKGGVDSASVNLIVETLTPLENQVTPEQFVQESIDLDMAALGTGANVNLPSDWLTDNAGGQVEVNSSSVYGIPGEARNVMELARNEGDPSNIYTTVHAEAGETVNLSFDYSARAGQEGDDSMINVLVNGQIIDTVSADVVGFNNYQFSFEATGEPMRVELQAVQHDSMGGLVDNLHIDYMVTPDFVSVSLDMDSIAAAGINSTLPGGWSTDNAGGRVEVNNSGVYGIPGEARNVMELARNEGDASNIYTTVTGKAGALMSLSFDYSARAGYEGSDSAVNVLVNGEVVDTISADAVGFNNYQVNFTATGEPMRVELQAVEHDSLGGLVDDIQINMVAPAVKAEDALQVDEPIVATDASDNIQATEANDTIDAGAGDDLIAGGAGNDTLTGGVGADTFSFELSDTVAPGVEHDVITDFSGADAIDLKDLLSGESQDAESLASYIHFTVEDGSTTMHVSANGEFAPGADVAGTETQQIEFAGVDLTAGGSMSDMQVIQNLLSNNQLITD